MNLFNLKVPIVTTSERYHPRQNKGYPKGKDNRYINERFQAGLNKTLNTCQSN